MKTIIQLIVCVLLSTSVYSQNDQLKIEMDTVKSFKDSISIELDVINLTNQDISVKNQDVKSICSNILHIKFVNIGNNQEHEVFPCTSVPDLNYIELNATNTFIIGGGKKQTVCYRFAKRDVSPYLKKGNVYSVFVGWYLKYISIQTTLENYFKNDIESNSVLFKYT